MGTAWFLATIVKIITVRSLQAFNLDERLNPEPEKDSAPSLNHLSLSETIGDALYWFIFLLFLAPVLDSLGLKAGSTTSTSPHYRSSANSAEHFSGGLIAVIGWFYR